MFALVTVKAGTQHEHKEDPEDKVNNYIQRFWPVSFRDFSLLTFTPSWLETQPPNPIPCL